MPTPPSSPSVTSTSSETSDSTPRFILTKEREAEIDAYTKAGYDSLLQASSSEDDHGQHSEGLTDDELTHADHNTDTGHPPLI